MLSRLAFKQNVLPSFSSPHPTPPHTRHTHNTHILSPSLSLSLSIPPSSLSLIPLCAIHYVQGAQTGTNRDLFTPVKVAVPSLQIACHFHQGTKWLGCRTGPVSHAVVAVRLLAVRFPSSELHQRFELSAVVRLVVDGAGLVSLKDVVAGAGLVLLKDVVDGAGLVSLKDVVDGAGLVSLKDVVAGAGLV